jgi:hypothetical protein
MINMQWAFVLFITPVVRNLDSSSQTSQSFEKSLLQYFSQVAVLLLLKVSSDGKLASS